MNLILIRGGRFDLVADEQGTPVGPEQVRSEQVRQEAMRRLREAGYMQSHVRSLATGMAMPKPLQYFKMQVDFVAERLSALSPIPADYASDLYWPLP